MKELRRKFGLAIGSIILLVFTGLITVAVFGVFGASLNAVGQAWFGLFSFIVLMASITVFGREAYDAIRSMRSGEITEDKSGE